MSQHSMICAGIDTGKYKLDVVIDGSGEQLQVDNIADGQAALSAWLKRHRSGKAAQGRAHRLCAKVTDLRQHRGRA
jgi:transposase